MKTDLEILRQIIAELENPSKKMPMDPVNAAIFYLKALEKKMRKEQKGQQTGRKKIYNQCGRE